MKTEHIPGPWKFSPLGKELYIENEAPTLVCDLQFTACADDAERQRVEATARLIAAAPELLEACKLMYADLKAYQDNPGGHIPTSGMLQAFNAIAKATAPQD